MEKEAAKEVTDPKKEISSALAKAWGTMENPKHNRTVTVRMKTGGSYKFEYTDLGGIIDNVKPHFKEHGIMITQEASTMLNENKSYIVVSTKLIHTSGETLQSKPLIVLSSNNIQDMGGQITYLKRYSLSAMLGISTEEDDDANATLGNQTINNNDKQKKQPEPKQTEPEPKQVLRAIIEAKFIQGGGTVEQFNAWYDKQAAAGVDNNKMDEYLTKKLIENKNKKDV